MWYILNVKKTITLDEVRHVAKLAKLPLTPQEEQIFFEQLEEIVDYINLLSKAQTTEVEPIYNATGLKNISRKDEDAPCLTHEEALANAHLKKKGLFLTKGVFKNE